MSTQNEFDIGPLTWVKGEIDQALSKALEGLDQFVAKPDDVSPIKFCETHLHQVNGAIHMVGLDGVARFSDEVERVVQALGKQEIPVSPPNLELVRRSIQALSKYLNELVDGKPNIPLSLFPEYKNLLDARGVERIYESDLFFPDLGLRAPKSVSAPPVAEADIPKFARAQRMQYQKGLLRWLRNQTDVEGLQAMRDALEAIERTQAQPVNRTFWWSAVGYLEALKQGGVEQGFVVKQLCGRIDQQIRKLVEGSSKVAERLTRDVLYFVAKSGPATDRIRVVKQVFGLNELLPQGMEQREAAAAEVERLQPLLRELRDLLAPAKETWLKFTAGNKDSLKSFADQMKRIVAKSADVPKPELATLLGAIGNGTEELTARNDAGSETVAMEMATSLLLAENALENYGQLTDEFSRQAEIQGKRLQAAIQGTTADLPEAVPLLDEMSRRAQEKLLLAQVGQEILTNLRHIEQVLDAFFRDHGKRGELGSIDPYIKQIFGALQILELERAADLLKACEDMIHDFAKPDHAVVQGELELVAEGLSSLGFYIEAVQHARTDAYEIIAPVLKRLPGIKGRQREAGATETEVVQSTESVESGLTGQKRELQDLFAAWKQQPGDMNVGDKLRTVLVALSQDADLVADAELKQKCESALKLLEQGIYSELENAIASITAPKVAAVAPSEQTARLVKESKDVIDAELLEIYLQEAQEVLATVREHLAICAQHPDDQDALTTIRRSFHTLKGSGRMVGLLDLGEVAWGVEQVLNKWLAEERHANERLLKFVQNAHDAFQQWVDLLSRDGQVDVDALSLMMEAENLKGEDETAPVMEGPSLGEPAEPSTPVESQPATEVIELEILEQPVAAEPEILLTLPVEEIQATEPESSLDESVVLEETPEPQEADSVIQEPEAPDDVTIGDHTVSSSLYEIFLEEAGEHLDWLEQELQELKKSPGNVVSPDCTRAAHTLCGIANTLGFSPLADLSYSLEQWLMDLMENPCQVSEEALGVMEGAVREMKHMYVLIYNRKMPEPAVQHVAGLEKLLNDARAEREIHAMAPETAPEPIEPIQETIIEEPVAVTPPPVTESVTDLLPAASPVKEVLVSQIEESGIRDDIDQELLPIFLEEAHEIFPLIGRDIRAWRAAPSDSEVQQSLQRGLHTLKGSARMAGAMRLGELTHRMETHVIAAQDSGQVTPPLFDELENFLDRLSGMLERLEKGPEAAEAPAVPTVTRLETAAPVKPLAAEPDQSSKAMLRVRADVVDRLVNQAGEVSIARSRIEGEMLHFKQSLLELTENVIRLRNQLREVEIQAESQMQSRLSHAQDVHMEFDPLEFDRFTRLQELTRMMAESVNDVATIQQTLLRNLDETDAAIVAQARMNRELQQQLMGIRMVPISSITERLHRIVRQTSKELDKQANLDIEGANVEIDRSVLEKMTAPFEHLLRNALAHGIESAENRHTLGKPEAGQIKMAARQEGNEIILTISDDGSGIDLVNVRQKAEQMGLIQPDAALSDARVLENIFISGFSTAQEVSQVAGRGIGMDVVRSEIASLGGRIDVTSEKDKGTTFNIYLPLTTAVSQVVLVRAGEATYAIPSSMVEQVQELKPDRLADVYNQHEVNWLNNRYPLSYFPRLLGDIESSPEPKPYTSIILLRSGSQRVAIHVDELVGNQEVVIKNIGPQLARVPGVTGATVLGTGRIVLIINPVQLANRESPATSEPAQVALASADEQLITAPLIMVVDDSLTVRKITGRLLSKEGYLVVTAKDGVDALQQLQGQLPDVMLVDIEMPRMDGFEFTKNVRNDPKTSHIPIIMITSRTAEKHRNYAKELGVNVYLGKPYQEEELLAHISHFVQENAGKTVPA